MKKELDVEKLYVAVDKKRRQLRLSWRALSRQTGISNSTLHRLAYGYKPDVDTFLTLMNWLYTDFYCVNISNFIKF